MRRRREVIDSIQTDPVPLFRDPAMRRSHRRPVCRYCLNYHELESFVGQDKNDLATVAEQN